MKSLKSPQNPTCVNLAGMTPWANHVTHWGCCGCFLRKGDGSKATNWDVALCGRNREVTKSFPAHAQGQYSSPNTQLISRQAGQDTFVPFAEGKTAQLQPRALKVTFRQTAYPKYCFLCHYSALWLSSLKSTRTSQPVPGSQVVLTGDIPIIFSEQRQQYEIKSEL